MKKYKRVILKLSGELLGGDKNGLNTHLDFKKIKALAEALQVLTKKGVEVGIVLGAGNIFRARHIAHGEVDRVAADHMGMMATIINALALQSALVKSGVDARVLSAISMPEIMENYVHKRAINHLKHKRVVIFAGGTGRPFFTTDTAAVIRALEVQADVVLKASTVDGVYNKDPKKHSGAKKYTSLSFTEALSKKLEVMDAASFALAQENKLTIVVFKYSGTAVIDAALGKRIGTLITA